MHREERRRKVENKRAQRKRGQANDQATTRVMGSNGSLDSVRLLLGLAGLICIDTLSRVRGSKMAAAGNGVRRMEGELRIVAW